jgi:hypothetical protein
MSPIERARKVYDTERCARTFGEDINLYLQNGFVFSTPDYFIMGRPVDHEQCYEMVTNPEFVFPREVQDCWLVALAAGDDAFAQFFRLEPYPLPYIAFERDNKLRVYRSGQILRGCLRG